MAGFDAWIGDCHLRDDDGQELACRAVVWADSYDRFRTQLQVHLAQQGLSLLWLEEVLPASQYLARNGAKRRPIGALAQAVHDLHRVELGPMVALGEGAEPSAQQSYLRIEEIKYEPLGDPSDVPSWERDWIGPELKELLFGQPADAPKLRTYLIVDAAQRKNVTGLFDIDSGVVDVPVQCLFKGDAAQELKEVAPYLIDMTLPDGAWDNRDLVPGFHRDFFRRHWGKNTGIFIRTTALMAEVWGHFRKFTKANMQEDGRGVFFRFYDPRILPAYLQNICGDSGKIRCFCVDEAGEIYRLLIENGEGSVFDAGPDVTALADVRRPAFILSYMDFQTQAESVKAKRAMRMAERLKQDFPTDLDEKSLEATAAYVSKIINRFNEYGFVRQEHLHFFAAWSVFFGLGFEDKDPDGILSEICRSNLSEDEKFHRFKGRFEQFTYRQTEAG